MIETPAPGLQNESSEKLPDLSWIGAIIGALICCVAIYSELKFRHALMALPAGTSIRPMGFAVMEIGFCLFGLLLGIPISALGIALARMERKRVSFWLGIAGLVLNLLPLPITRIMDDQTMRMTKVQMVP